MPLALVAIGRVMVQCWHALAPSRMSWSWVIWTSKAALLEALQILMVSWNAQVHTIHTIWGISISSIRYIIYVANLSVFRMWPYIFWYVCVHHYTILLDNAILESLPHNCAMCTISTMHYLYLMCLIFFSLIDRVLKFPVCVVWAVHLRIWRAYVKLPVFNSQSCVFVDMKMPCLSSLHIIYLYLYDHGNYMATVVCFVRGSRGWHLL